MPDDLSIEGLQQAQQENARLIASLRPGKAIGRAVQFALIEAHRISVSLTHVITGTLRASERIRQDGDHGMLYIDPAAVNPRTGEKPANYAMDEHMRGGKHAFFERTLTEGHQQIGRAAIAGFLQGIR